MTSRSVLMTVRRKVGKSIRRRKASLSVEEVVRANRRQMGPLPHHAMRFLKRAPRFGELLLVAKLRVLPDSALSEIKSPRPMET
jgi:hypothetical protein